MSVQFVLGRAGSGKTSYCIRQIHQQLQKEPNGLPIIMLVPEQASFETEHALVTSPKIGGILRAQVLSFRRLAYRVIQETGGASVQAIDETGKKILLYRIMEEWKPQLEQLRIHEGKKGWMDKCYELFTELRRYQVTPLQMRRVIRELPEAQTNAKLLELWQLYEAFTEQMAQHYLDSESLLDRLAAQLHQAEFLQGAQIYIDGFHGFTPQEFSVIGELMQHCAKVVITLCVDRDYYLEETLDELNLFYPTASTLLKLRHLAEELQVQVDNTYRLPEDRQDTEPSKTALDHLRKYYDVNRTWSETEVPEEIQLRAAGNRRTEVEAVAREIHRLVREKKARFRDVLVMIRQPEDYTDRIQTIFGEHGIPCFVDQKMSVDHHPLVEFIRSALEIVRKHWRYDSIFRCVKTDFLLPLEPDKEAEWRYEMDELENYVLAFGIQGSRWLDEEPWSYRLYQSLEVEESDDDAGKGEHAANLERIHQLRKRIVRPLSSFQKRLTRAKNVREQTEAVYYLLEEVKAPRRLEAWSVKEVEAGRPYQAKQHVQVWNSLIQVLDQLVEVMGEESAPLELFEGMLETGLEQIRISAVPPAIDQVMVGDIDRSRSSHKKYVFILGFNDGVLPAPFPEEGLLTEAEREQLQQAGLELAPDSRRRLLDEQFLIYTLLTLPSKGLWLSYTMADEEGKALLPSEIVRRLQRMFPKLVVEDCDAEPYPAQALEKQWPYIAHPPRTMAHLTVQLRNWLQHGHIHPVWWDVYNWFAGQDQWKSRLERQLQGLFYNNAEPPLQPETIRMLYGETLQASVSRMEKYIGCPFAHFISYGLRLKERRVFRLEAPDIGQLFHAALNWISKRLLEQGMGWQGLSEHACRELADAAVEVLAPRLQGEILFSSKRYHYIAHKLKQIISRTAYVLSRHAEQGEFMPVGLELAFGSKGQLPPLTFELAEGYKMEVAGRIDRVDQAESEQGLLLRVMDYKSSQTSLHLTDVFYGLSLQLLAYLDVVVTNAERWLGRRGLPAGVLYFHIQDPLVARSNPIEDDKAEQEYLKQFKMKGWIMSDANVVKKMDISLDKGHSEIIPVGLKANGDFYKTSSVYSEDQWTAVREHVHSVMKQIGTEITSGRVEAAPFRLGKQTPCQYCSYKPICQFSPNDGEQDFRYLPQLSKDEIWTRFIAKQQIAAGGSHDEETDGK